MLRAIVGQLRVPPLQRAASTSLHNVKKATNTNLPLPNARPEHISERFDRLLGSNRVMRCILYGVQDVTSTTISRQAIEATAEAVTTVMKQTNSSIVAEVKPTRFVPNPRPLNLAPMLNKLFDMSPLLQCVAYGVQETLPAAFVTPTLPEASKAAAMPLVQALPTTAQKIKQAGRGIFKDLDIMTASLAAKSAKHHGEVPTWY